MLKKVNLLCITCPREDVSYQQQVELACQGGADVIQLRDKKISDRDLFDLSLKLQQICKKYNVYFTVNNRVDIADISDSDGVHLGQTDLPVWYARKVLGNNKIIGISASGYDKVIEAAKLPVDYIGCGAIFPTTTKPEANVRGLEVLKKIKQTKIEKPIIAIGGINKNNVGDVIRAGADGVAVVRAVCGAQDIKKEAVKIIQEETELTDKFEDLLNKNKERIIESYIKQTKISCNIKKGEYESLQEYDERINKIKTDLEEEKQKDLFEDENNSLQSMIMTTEPFTNILKYFQTEKFYDKDRPKAEIISLGEIKVDDFIINIKFNKKKYSLKYDFSDIGIGKVELMYQTQNQFVIEPLFSISNNLEQELTAFNVKHLGMKTEKTINVTISTFFDI